MTESAVLAEPSIETHLVQPIPVPAVDKAKPVRKQTRFFASLRFNGLRYLVLIGALSLAWGLLRAAMWEGAGSPEAKIPSR